MAPMSQSALRRRVLQNLRTRRLTFTLVEVRMTHDRVSYVRPWVAKHGTPGRARRSNRTRPVTMTGLGVFSACFFDSGLGKQSVVELFRTRDFAARGIKVRFAISLRDAFFGHLDSFDRLEFPERRLLSDLFSALLQDLDALFGSHQEARFLVEVKVDVSVVLARDANADGRLVFDRRVADQRELEF